MVHIVIHRSASIYTSDHGAHGRHTWAKVIKRVHRHADRRSCSLLIVANNAGSVRTPKFHKRSSYEDPPSIPVQHISRQYRKANIPGKFPFSSLSIAFKNPQEPMLFLARENRAKNFVLAGLSQDFVSD